MFKLIKDTVLTEDTNFDVVEPLLESDDSFDFDDKESNTKQELNFNVEDEDEVEESTNIFEESFDFEIFSEGLENYETDKAEEPVSDEDENDDLLIEDIDFDFLLEESTEEENLQMISNVLSVELEDDEDEEDDDFEIEDLEAIDIIGDDEVQELAVEEEVDELEEEALNEDFDFDFDFE